MIIVIFVVLIIKVFILDLKWKNDFRFYKEYIEERKVVWMLYLERFC